MDAADHPGLYKEGQVDKASDRLFLSEALFNWPIDGAFPDIVVFPEALRTEDEGNSKAG